MTSYIKSWPESLLRELRIICELRMGRSPEDAALELKEIKKIDRELEERLARRHAAPNSD